jgi:hypothetical protein
MQVTPTADVPDPGRGLSYLQKDILVWLWRTTRHTEEHGNDFSRSEARIWGVRWSPGKGQSVWEPSDRVCFSRALRRLEQRGLALRKNDISGGQNPNGRPHAKPRTTRALLTDTGREVAERLTKEVDGVANRPP